MSTSNPAIPERHSSKLPPMSRDKADTLLLLISCALVLLPQTPNLPAWVSILAGGVLLWRGWITFSGRRMPSKWLLLPIAAASIVAVYFTYHSFFGQESGVAMVALLLVFKLLEMHAKRDLFVVLMVGYFVMLTSFFYSQSIGTAVLMSAALIALLTTQLSFQYTNAAPPLAKRLRLGVLIFVLSIPLTLVLFFLFPRIQGPLWSMPGDVGSGKTGLSDSMSPGNISDLAQSDDIAFRAQFTGTAPPQNKLYWRAIILDYYDGKTWSHKSGRNQAAPSAMVSAHGAETKYTVTLEPTGRRWLFTLDLPLQAPFVTDNPTSFSSDMQLQANHSINQRVRYSATSYVDYSFQADASAPTSPFNLELPPGFNPKSKAFAENLRQQSSDNQQLIDRTLKFFHEQNFSYTLQPPLLGKNAVDEFLFNTRAGFCEHYAGAFVVLMRAAGIPSRVVTGYQGGDINPLDGYMEIRQADAHAWAEVWLAHRGWVRVDPTAAVAPERVQKHLANVIPRTILGGLVTLSNSHETLLGKLQLDWGALNNAWNQWVLNYDTDKQKGFLQSLGFDDADWKTLISLMAVLGVVVMAMIAIPLVMKRQKTEPLQALYLYLCQHLARSGYPRQPHEGPRAYSMRLASAECTLPTTRKAATIRFLALYESIRYGRPEVATLKQHISQLKTILAECK